ncbi:hypothetical protein HRR83_008850 [Exophiala dermatitidis]|uniref:Uncharacterized protein n=1 Tax=Exophiala dermatitidis TaxID=5970 RepID=A0AAN6IQ15_EXODE|nr:hypothetical protein HRR73_008974 [Exophiala dermatitidis]KAJ4508377.1 hypothetical protein HRR74_007776 [Exophiala dermatitidis]KAJ4533403.1 hypothetical protein HRR77_008567 [Exophiala dermatitidis]KAJ4540297.1 hypothetical protein HRR76_003707 [Exophiala dermatitidis]KAJ4559043.1 hypothetical protein HRR79_008470 [Exophiala dermatitidis]
MTRRAHISTVISTLRNQDERKPLNRSNVQPMAGGSLKIGILWTDYASSANQPSDTDPSDPSHDGCKETFLNWDEAISEHCLSRVGREVWANGYSGSVGRMVAGRGCISSFAPASASMKLQKNGDEIEGQLEP